MGFDSEPLGLFMISVMISLLRKDPQDHFRRALLLVHLDHVVLVIFCCRESLLREVYGVVEVIAVSIAFTISIVVIVDELSPAQKAHWPQVGRPICFGSEGSLASGSLTFGSSPFRQTRLCSQS